MYGGAKEAMEKARNQSASNNSSGAINTLEAYLETDPYNIEARMLLAQIAYKANMDNYSIMQLQIVLDLDPDYIDARKALVTIYKNNKKTIKQAYNEFQFLLEKFPDDPDLMNSYAVFCRLQLLKNDESEKYYLKAIELKPNDSKYHMNYAILLINDLKQYDKGRAELEESLRLDPSNDRARDALDKLMRKKYRNELSRKERFAFFKKK